MSKFNIYSVVALGIFSISYANADELPLWHIAVCEHATSQCNQDHLTRSKTREEICNNFTSNKQRSLCPGTPDQTGLNACLNALPDNPCGAGFEACKKSAFQK